MFGPENITQQCTAISHISLTLVFGGFFWWIKIRLDSGELEQFREELLLFFLLWSLCMLSDSTLDLSVTGTSFVSQSSQYYIFRLNVQNSLLGYVEVFNKIKS